MSKLEDELNAAPTTIRNTPGLGKKMAKYGAIGAVIAIPVPFVGPPLGAVAGAAYAYWKRNKG